MNSNGISIFYSYSHKDERFCQDLRSHLSILERNGVISSWHDRRIKPGQLWQKEIDRHVRSADIIIILVSSDFVASDYCYDEELKIAMERHESNQAIVVPVILRPVDFSETPFSKIQSLPKDAQPITKWVNVDEAWLNVVEGIKNAIEEVKIIKNRSTNSEGFRGINEYLMRELTSLEQAFEVGLTQTTNRGLATGLVDLDRVTDGLQKSDLIVVAGRPGMGKTDLALSFACNVVMAQKKPVGYFSLNLPVDRITRKMLSSLGRLSSYKLFKGDMCEEDWPRLTAAVSMLKDLPLFIDDHISLTIDQLIERATKLKEDKGVELIIIDSLQHIDFGGEYDYRVVTKSLSRLARELDMPLVVTTTIARDVENRPNKRPILSDLGVWSSLEEDSSTLMFLYRDELYNGDTMDVGITEIIIAKNASASLVGTTKVVYVPDHCTFSDLL
jgi:replicative DNA helicase